MLDIDGYLYKNEMNKMKLYDIKHDLWDKIFNKDLELIMGNIFSSIRCDHISLFDIFYNLLRT